MRWIILCCVCLALCACAASQTASVKYVDLTPTQVGACVFWQSSDAGGFGVTHKGCDRYVIENEKASIAHSDSASGAGPLQQVVNTAVGSGGNAAVMAPIMGALLPTTSSSSTTTVKTSK